MAARRARIDKAARVRHLLALDAQNVMSRLATRQDSMVGLFSRLRDREPMLTAVETRFGTITFSELSGLAPPEQRAVSRFHEVLADLRWYLAYTEDMPGQVQARLTAFVRSLESAFSELVSTIGTPEDDGVPVGRTRVGRRAR